jgi:hypothetical protein
MTTVRVDKIGLVADYSERGDWAFNLALELARSRQMQLNIFHFLQSPYSIPQDITPSEIPAEQCDAIGMVAEDRELREYYDDRLGDFVDVGFRACGNPRHNLELKRCLKGKEYQLLIIPYLDYGVSFGNMPLEEFAYRFTAPVVLVGPENQEQYSLNPAARLLNDSLTLPLQSAVPIKEPVDYQKLAVL